MPKPCMCFWRATACPRGFRPDFSVAELGFGTGLNLLATAVALRQAGILGSGALHQFRGLSAVAEGYPRRAGSFSDPPTTCCTLFWRHGTQGKRTFDLPGVSVSIIEGDVRQTLPRWQGRADAWFLDGFSPAKNPELWEPDLMDEVARHTAPGGHLCDLYRGRPCAPQSLARGRVRGGTRAGPWSQAPHDHRSAHGARMSESNTRLGILLMIATTLVFAFRTGCRGIWRANTT